MTDTALPAARRAAITPLRSKIGWICHLIRVLAAIWIVWLLVRIIWVWWDRPGFARYLSRTFNVDPSSVSDTGYNLAFATSLIAWAIAAAFVWALWRMCGTFLAGRIFTVEGFCHTGAVAMFGFLAIFIDVIHRPVFHWVLMGHLPIPWYGYFNTNDLLHLVMAFFVFVVAVIFKAETEAEAKPPVDVSAMMIG